MASNNNTPLDWRTPIVGTDGKPTPQFIRLWQLLDRSSSSNVVTGNDTPQNGGFNATGYMLDGEELARWAFPTGVTFSDNSPYTFVNVDTPGSSDGTLSLTVNGDVIGSIFCEAESPSGIVSFTDGSYYLASRQEMVLYAPDPAVFDLGDLFGQISGTSDADATSAILTQAGDDLLTQDGITLET